MDLEQELESFLRHYFKVSNLERPLFYNFPIGIRFEIGVESTKTKEYEQIGNFRANEIFNSLFKENDRILLIVDHYEAEEKDYYGCSIKRISSLIRDYSDTACCFIKHIIDNEEVSIKRYIYKTKVSDLKIKKLIMMIIKDDFKKLSINKMNSVVYIINMDNATIYFLYDDRGLDIISHRLATIAPIYYKYSKWILDYDRNKIDSLFAGKGI